MTTRTALRLRAGSRRLAGVLLGVALPLLLLGVAQPVSAARSAGVVRTDPATDRQGPLVIVLDLSGSMNDQDANGVVKLEGAKSALEKLVGRQPVGAELGLWTYPGGQADPTSGCSPGEFEIGGVIAEVTDPADLAAQIDILTADGGTPTGPALRTVADRLKALGYTGATILLVSDGESNCGPPPCEVAQQIVDEGFDVTVDALGFRLSEAGTQEMTCISSTTGGRYVPVDDTAQLDEYLTTLAVPNLALQVTAPTQAIVGQGITVSATVSNPSSRPVADAQISLTFNDKASQAIFPAVLPPRYRLGNIAPGGSVSRTWTITAGVDLTGGAASYRVSTWGKGVGATDKSGTITVNSTEGLKNAAGPWLKSINDTGNVLIMGDSYSAGEGAPPYVDGTDKGTNRCHRSDKTHTYPQFDTGRRTNIACSGAVVNNMESAQYVGDAEENRPQFAQLRDMDVKPDLVVLTLGGNDIGFGDIIKGCLGPSNCSESDLRTKTAVKIAALNQPQDTTKPGSLTQAYLDIYETLNAHDAEAKRKRVAPLLVLAYPLVLPVTNTTKCAGFSQTEVVFAKGVIASLNTTIERAVRLAAEGGRHIYFVGDTSRAVQPNHTACDPDPYIRDVNALSGLAAKAFDEWLKAQAAKFRTNDYPSLTQQFMHPLEKGYQAMTVATYVWSTSLDLDLGPGRPIPPAYNYVEPEGVDLWLAGATVRPGETETVTPGSTTTVEADGLPPHHPVLISLNSVRRTLATSMTDEAGRLIQVVTIPADTPIGAHTLHIEYLQEGAEKSLDATLHLHAPIPLWVLAIATFGLLGAVGALALGLREHRSRRQTS